MKIGIMQPYFFPYLGYWQTLNAVDRYVIYDDVNFIKNGWINRNNILLNGQKHMLTLPLDGASPFLPINQIKITPRTKEKEKLLRTIEMAYKKAPYFNQVYPIVSSIITEESNMIAKALINQFKQVCDYLGIKTELIVSSEIKKDNSLHAQDKVIHICKLLGGTKYINAIGGMELYSPTDFQNHGIDLRFMKTNITPYKQFKNEFVPGLSMIDIMMFNSPEEIHKMLNNYELITKSR
ncbi:MAG: WbqC family protein [Alphaproteobacteria bacterium]|nr:WbqC family protein [Alphaproteobacteria bacterium]